MGEILSNLIMNHESTVMIGDIPDVRREKNGGKKKRKRVKVEPLILATGGMTSAGGEGLPLFLASKEAGGYHQKYNSGNPKKLFLRENKKVLSD